MLSSYNAFKRIPFYSALILFAVSWGAAALSVDNALDSARKRLAENYELSQLRSMTPPQIMGQLTEEEYAAFANEHIRFQISCPAKIYVLYDRRFEEKGPFEAFWLNDRAFERTDVQVSSDGDYFIGYARNFDAGAVGLGINSFSGNYLHYFIAVQPLRKEDTLTISGIYPQNIRAAAFQKGIRPYTHPEWQPIDSYSPALEGATLLQVDARWRRTTKLLDFFAETDYPASPRPDNIILTWSSDPRHTQSILWRTSEESRQGAVAYMKKKDYRNFTPGAPVIKEAQSLRHESIHLLNQPVIYTHTATLTDLEPDTSYVYAVGDGSSDGWSALNEFTTAPDKEVPFSFIYMGDVQVGYPRWRSLLERAWQDQPNARFYMLAGDNVNRGVDRNEWDAFFAHTAGVFDHRVVIPALGNHEYIGGDPTLFEDFFVLPENGPENCVPEHCFSFEYSNALFVIVDTNLFPEEYVGWLDETLEQSRAVWKFVMMHHPLYSSGVNRDNVWLRDALLPVFDRHHVDMVLQGHDHAYLRTGPMRDNQKVERPADGTYYVVSVSGTKLYKLADRPYSDVAYEHLSTYQIINLQLNPPRLVYRSFDVDGNMKDEVIIEK